MSLNNPMQIKCWLDELNSNGMNVGLKELLLYQGKTALLDLTPRIGNQSKLAGNYIAKSKGRGMEFDEVRHYQQGDDPRMIDWRVTARTGKAHTKLFREEKERPIFIMTDLSQTMQFGSQLLFKSVQACHIAALTAWASTKRGDRVGGVVFNNHGHYELKPRSRQRGVLQYLHTLELLSKPERSSKQSAFVNSEQSFSDACARLRHIARPGALLCLISDFRHLSELAIKHLSHVSRHCELVAYRINDPLELQLPSSDVEQTLQVQDQQKQGLLMLGNRNYSKKYQTEASKALAQQDKLLRKVRCKVINISAAASLESQFR